MWVSASGVSRLFIGWYYSMFWWWVGSLFLWTMFGGKMGGRMGVMDKGAFHSAALSLLGIPEHLPGTEEEKVCTLHSQQVILRALDYARWSFATKETRVLLDGGIGDLPHDCLRVQGCSLERWQIRGRRIVNKGEGGEESCTLSYTSDAYAQAVALPEHEPFFNEACIYLLAARVAPRLTTNFQLAQALEQRAMDFLYQASLRDAQATSSNDQKPPSPQELLSM